MRSWGMSPTLWATAELKTMRRFCNNRVQFLEICSPSQGWKEDQKVKASSRQEKFFCRFQINNNYLHPQIGTKHEGLIGKQTHVNSVLLPTGQGLGEKKTCFLRLLDMDPIVTKTADSKDGGCSSLYSACGWTRNNQCVLITYKEEEEKDYRSLPFGGETL